MERKCCLLCEKVQATREDWARPDGDPDLCFGDIDCPRFGQERQIIAELREEVEKLKDSTSLLLAKLLVRDDAGLDAIVNEWSSEVMKMKRAAESAAKGEVIP